MANSVARPNCKSEGCPKRMRKDSKDGVCFDHRNTEYQQNWRAANPDKLAGYRTNFTKISTLTKARNQYEYAARRTLLYVENIDSRKIEKRDDSKCHVCGLLVECDGTVDHVIPATLGGPGCMDNMAWSHKTCNSAKLGVVIDTNRLPVALAAFEAFHGHKFDGRRFEIEIPRGGFTS